MIWSKEDTVSSRFSETGEKLADELKHLFLACMNGTATAMMTALQNFFHGKLARHVSDYLTNMLTQRLGLSPKNVHLVRVKTDKVDAVPPYEVR
jgi:hypothetical protein